MTDWCTKMTKGSTENAHTLWVCGLKIVGSRVARIVTIKRWSYDVAIIKPLGGFMCSSTLHKMVEWYVHMLSGLAGNTVPMNGIAARTAGAVETTKLISQEPLHLRPNYFSETCAGIWGTIWCKYLANRWVDHQGMQKKSERHCSLHSRDR